MDQKPVVLIVEDVEMSLLIAERLLSPHAEVLTAKSLHEGRKIIHARRDIAYVILDGNVPNFDDEVPRPGDTTHELAREILDLHPRMKMYSASSSEDLNDELAAIGCIRSDKNTAPDMVLADILKKT